MPKVLPHQINNTLSKQLNRVTLLIESKMVEVYPQSAKSTFEDQFIPKLLKS